MTGVQTCALPICDERFGNARLGAPAIRRGVLRALCAYAQTGPEIRTTDAVWGIAEQGARLTPDACTRALKGIGPRVIELVCHPGLRADGDPALPATFGRMRVHELWEPEFRSLMDGAWQEAAARNGWQLTSFDRL